MRPQRVRSREEEHDELHESEDGDEDDNEDADLNDDEWELPSAASTRIKPSSDGQAAPAGGASRSLYKDDERSAASRCGDRRDSRDVRPANEFVLHDT